MSGKEKKTSAAKFEDILKELNEKRNRIGKKVLTSDERCEILEQIYDSALFSLQAAIMTGVFKGSMAAAHILERARLEVAEIHRARLSEDGYKNAKIGYQLPSFDEIVNAPKEA